MAVGLLPLCGIPKVASRDGYAGPNAHIILPFYQYALYFFSGQQYTFPGADVAQDQSVSINGLTQVDTYTKDCCACLWSPGPGITYVAP